MLPATTVTCPYCGEAIELLIDLPVDNGAVDDQRYIEDCQVCCRPIMVVVAIDDDGEARVDALSEDDA
jgi:hypothetical protein